MNRLLALANVLSFRDVQGVLAFEIALQLVELNIPVAGLILFDSYIFDEPLPDMSKKDELEILTSMGIDPKSIEAGFLIHDIKQSIKLQTRYTPRLYVGNTYLIKAGKSSEQCLSFEKDPYNGWLPYVKPQIKNWVIESATHENLLSNEHINEVGSIVCEIMAEINAREKDE